MPLKVDDGASIDTVVEAANAMEPSEGSSSGQPAASAAARRSLRAARSATPAAATTQPSVQGTAVPVVVAPPLSGGGSESPRSDVSEGRASRSSRLSNPEFAAKHKAFMAKVTAATKGSMDTYLTAAESSSTTASISVLAESSATATGGKRRLSPRAEDQKRRRSTRTNSAGVDVQNDSYCWICHKVMVPCFMRSCT